MINSIFVTTLETKYTELGRQMGQNSQDSGMQIQVRKWDKNHSTQVKHAIPIEADHEVDCSGRLD